MGSSPSAASSYEPIPFSAFDFDASLPNDVRFPPPSNQSDDEFPPSPFSDFHWDSTQFRNVNTRFEAANESASAALADIHAREPQLARVPFSQTGANLPRGPIPSQHKVAPSATTGRHLGCVEVQDDEDEKGEDDVRTSDEEDENGNGTGRSKANFGTGNALVKVASAAVDLEPFLAARGDKGAAWEALAEKLSKAKEFKNTKISGASVKKKVLALNPGANRKLANIIGNETAAGITIAALLERLETQYDQAKGKSDKAKAETKKKNDEDREGGEAIRRASMDINRKRKRDSGDTDDEGVAATAQASTSASLETLDSDSDDKTNASKGKKGSEAKRRRTNPSVVDTQVLTIMEKSDRRAAKHEEFMRDTFKQFVDNSNRQKEATLELFKALVEKQ
ncbi:hypothetical protein R3P38DRAFT_2557492 [Favolaschia claudopus]|uniref:Uncharacterized protein n=1 Tax=Favolaschia claudopus TaxID=2862362 RepID=A0AAW0A7A0_9AGAR